MIDAEKLNLKALDQAAGALSELGTNYHPDAPGWEETATYCIAAFLNTVLDDDEAMERAVEAAFRAPAGQSVPAALKAAVQEDR